ncbi:hypothetical protein MMC20_000452 [Loxospora ochrophaea]|nr:hypothetical protein [Loxospora ochrophaea]
MHLPPTLLFLLALPLTTTALAIQHPLLPSSSSAEKAPPPDPLLCAFHPLSTTTSTPSLPPTALSTLATHLTATLETLRLTPVNLTLTHHLSLPDPTSPRPFLHATLTVKYTSFLLSSDRNSRRASALQAANCQDYPIQHAQWASGVVEARDQRSGDEVWERVEWKVEEAQAIAAEEKGSSGL